MCARTAERITRTRSSLPAEMPCSSRLRNRTQLKRRDFPRPRAASSANSTLPPNCTGRWKSSTECEMKLDILRIRNRRSRASRCRNTVRLKPAQNSVCRLDRLVYLVNVPSGFSRVARSRSRSCSNAARTPADDRQLRVDVVKSQSRRNQWLRMGVHTRAIPQCSRILRKYRSQNAIPHESLVVPAYQSASLMRCLPSLYEK